MIRYIFFDTEFTGLRKDTDLISIGLIADDGSKFYYEFNDYKDTYVDKWIKENVINNLSFNSHKDYNILLSGEDIRHNRDYAAKGSLMQGRELLHQWLYKFQGEDIQFVSDVAHYDFVLLVDLLADTALDIPKNIVATCLDINQLIADYHNVDLGTAFDISREEILNTHGVEIKGFKHNALYDAKVIKALYNLLKK